LSFALIRSFFLLIVRLFRPFAATVLLWHILFLPACLLLPHRVPSFGCVFFVFWSSVVLCLRVLLSGSALFHPPPWNRFRAEVIFFFLPGFLNVVGSFRAYTAKFCLFYSPPNIIPFMGLPWRYIESFFFPPLLQQHFSWSRVRWKPVDLTFLGLSFLSVLGPFNNAGTPFTLPFTQITFIPVSDLDVGNVHPPSTFFFRKTPWFLVEWLLHLPPLFL